MNFYPFNIGDFAAATRHLSWDERAAYREMLDVYYAREEPLPADTKAIYRLVGAASPKHRQAVDVVLQEFFTKDDDGYRNARCEEEIAKANEITADHVDRKENEKERQRRHRERRKALFSLLRSHNIVPAYDTPTKTLEETLQRCDSNAPVTSTVTDLQRLYNPNPNPNPNPNTLALASESSARAEVQAHDGKPDPAHWVEVNRILSEKSADLDGWEDEFLHSIRWKPTLTKPQRDSLKSIQDRLSAKGEKPAPITSASVAVIEGTPAWEAWRKAGRIINNPVNLRDASGQIIGRGWYFPTEFPSSDSEAA